MGKVGAATFLWIWANILWRTDLRAPQNVNFLWRTESGAPQKANILWRMEAGAPQNVNCLWRTGPRAPQNVPRWTWSNNWNVGPTIFLWRI